MIRKNVLLFIMVLIIFALASSVVLPIGEGVLGGKGIHLGLDLVGGSHLVYQAQFPEETTVEEKARAMDRALDTIRTRIDKYGVLEPVIQEQEGERILVQLPAFTDIEEAKNLVEQTGYLELREVELDDDGKPVYLSHYLETPDPEFFDEGEEGTRIFVDENGSPVAFLTKEGDNLTYTDEAGNPIDVEELKQGSTQLLSWIPARGKDASS
jgi:preprotein translocase subunit SecD